MSIRGVPSRGRLILAACAVLCATCAEAAVNLELRPDTQFVSVGDIFEVTLVAVSDNALDQTFLSVQAIMAWDPARVEFLELRVLCPPAPCPDDTYGSWTSSGVSMVSPADGTLVFNALGPFLGDPRPVATPQGLRVVAFRFKSIASGGSAIRILPDLGQFRTAVDNAGVFVLGTIGPPSDVIAITCVTPEVAAVGSRYIRIIPVEGSAAVALRVTGDLDNPDIACVSRFVQVDARLGASPVLRTPDEWGTILLTGQEIIPDGFYAVRAECGPVDPGALVSPVKTVITWRWGDVNGDGVVDFADLSVAFSAAQGNPPPNGILQSVDQAPCVPDGVIDEQDIMRVQSAFGGAGYPCFTPCEPGPSADLFGDFVGCLSGPTVIAPIGCVRYDVSGDAHVDLADFARLQFDFGRR